MKDYKLADELKDISELESTININTKEREDLRNEIAMDISNAGSYNSKENKLINEIKNEKRIDFVIGIPGGGKSSTLANPLSEEHSSVIIDADIAKEKLPEYDGGKGAGRVHEESKKIFKKALDLALENKKNIVVAIVGKSMDSIMDIYNKAEKHGYEQHLHLNELPPQVAVDRSMDRYFQTGRYVDPDYIYFEVGNKPIENYKTLKEKNIFQSYQWLNNDVKLGEKPRVIERMTQQELENINIKETEVNYLKEGKRKIPPLSVDKIFSNTKEWAEKKGINNSKDIQDQGIDDKNKRKKGAKGPEL